MDDKVQAALEEAQMLMNELGTEDEDTPNSNNSNNVITEGGGISFSIDSDDEDDEEINLNNDNTPQLTDSHPLAGLSDASLLQQQQQQHPLYNPSNNSAAPSATSSTHTLPHSNVTMSPLQQQQQQPPFLSSQSQQPGPHPLSTSVSNNNNNGGGAGAAILGDAWKQQTSRFASAVGTMAQRVAHQVVNATSTQPPPHNMMSPLSAASSGSPTSAATTVNNNNMNNMAATPPSPSVHLHAELDNEQKAALIRTHVGDLLPGERVIMFVAHLMHVSDSTGFNYTANSGSNTSGGGSNHGNNSSSTSAIWCCAMTYYRLILFGTHPFSPPACPSDWNTACWPHRPVHLIQMPLCCMERVDKAVFAASTTASTGPSNALTNPNNLLLNPNAAAAGVNTTSLMGLHIVGKDNGRTIRFTTPSYADTVRAHEALQNYAFPGRRNLGYLFAFESKKDRVIQSIVTDAHGQKQVTLEPVAPRFVPLAEFHRQFSRNNVCGAATPSPAPWTVYTTANAQYQLCASYPSIVAGPSSIHETNADSLRVLQQSAAFRSEQRLPVLTYAHTRGGGSLWRCSQPKIGLQGNRNGADEWLLQQILESARQANQRSPAGPVLSRQVLCQLTGSASLEQFASNWMPSMNGGELKILDLRPRSSAMANRTAGYGYENTSNYPGTTLTFCGIGNIHAVRDAYQKVSSACLSLNTPDTQFASQVEDSKWLTILRNILSASWETAYWIHVFQLPVLLHCSHGWDRTSQVACLAQLLLDPYYRTMEGFACLVEKDFMAFGHPFHTRCAHGVGSGGNNNNNGVGNNNGMNGADFDEGQVSPIFLQFLDCVYQLVELYPEAFEITTRYLLDLSDHVYSCRFGNFLCDTERERETVAGIRQRTHSVWDFLEARHRNHKDPREISGGVLLMPLPTLLRNVSLWTDRHAKYGNKPTLRWLPPSALLPMKTPPPDGRHDDDTPQFHRIPTKSEAQSQLFMAIGALTSELESSSLEQTPESGADEGVEEQKTEQAEEPAPIEDNKDN